MSKSFEIELQRALRVPHDSSKKKTKNKVAASLSTLPSLITPSKPSCRIIEQLEQFPHTPRFRALIINEFNKAPINRVLDRSHDIKKVIKEPKARNEPPEEVITTLHQAATIESKKISHAIIMQLEVERKRKMIKDLGLNLNEQEFIQLIGLEFVPKSQYNVEYKLASNASIPPSCKYGSDCNNIRCKYCHFCKRCDGCVRAECNLDHSVCRTFDTNLCNYDLACCRMGCNKAHPISRLMIKEQIRSFIYKKKALSDDGIDIDVFIEGLIAHLKNANMIRA